MAFEYTPYRNPYVGTIADLMARGEDAKAKALVDVASAQARAAEAKGQIYGNAIQDIGQSASKALSDYTLEKQNAPIRAQEAEMRAMTLAAARDNQQIGRGKEFLASTMNPPDPNYQKDPVTGQSPLPGPPSPDNRDIYKPGPYGSKFMDPNLAQQRLVDAGFGAHLETLMPIVENQNARNSAFVAGKNKARAEYAREVLNVMRAGVPWTQALELVGNSGVENGVFDANDLANLTRQGEGQPPAAQQAILFNIMRQGGAETTFEAPGQQERLGGIPTGRSTGEKPLTPAEEEARAYATPPAARTPAQQAIIAGVVEKTAAGRAPVVPTFSVATPGMINGREMFFRTRSDGVAVDMEGKPFASGSMPTPVRPEAGRQPWQWVSRAGSDGVRTNVYTNSVRSDDNKVDPERPPTESQSKAANFYGVAADALKTVEELEPLISAEELLAIQKLPLDGVSGYFAASNVSENSKRYLRAINQFIEAEIRDKSGAAINASEYLADKATYMLTQGETPKLAEDRKRARRKVLEGLGRKAGPALNADDLMPTSGNTLNAKAEAYMRTQNLVVNPATVAAFLKKNPGFK